MHLKLQLYVLTGLILTGCSVVHHRDSSISPTEVSLRDDREKAAQARAELRQDIPELVRTQNEDLGVILDLMKDESMPPQSVRQRFLRHVEKVRRDFRRETDSTRDQFNKAERERRKNFLDNLHKEKEEFKRSSVGKKADREKSKQFYDALELKRRDFFDDERTNRKDYESDSRQKRDDFNSRMRDWQLQFNDSIRVYEHKWKTRSSKNPNVSARPQQTFDEKSLEAGQ